MTSGKNDHDLMRNVIQLIGNKHVAVFKHILNLPTFFYFATKNVAVNSIESSFNEDSIMGSALLYLIYLESYC